MLKKGRIVCVLICILVVLSGVVKAEIPKQIEMNLWPADYSQYGNRVLTELDCSARYLDLISYDLSNLDLSDQLSCLTRANFDTNTIWPDSLPSKFNPNEILEWGKNPGLKIQELHQRGITGKGVSVAIMDFSLLPTHREYVDQLRVLQEIYWPTDRAHMHGTAMASIMVGKSTGVAPEANLFFFPISNFEIRNSKPVMTATHLANAVERILEWNEKLPESEKIRVVASSTPWLPESENLDDLLVVLEKAKESGLFIISLNMYETHQLYYYGLQIGLNKNRDQYRSYTPDPWETWMWKVSHLSNLGELYDQALIDNPDELLLVPVDGKTVASPTGDDDYTFNRYGGWSWTPPYLAGLYALACQVEPDITPELFWETALETGHKKTVKRDGKRYQGKIVDPVKLIESLQK